MEPRERWKKIKLQYGSPVIEKIGQWKSKNADNFTPSVGGGHMYTYYGTECSVGLYRSTTADGNNTQLVYGWIALDGMLVAPSIRIMRENLECFDGCQKDAG